VARTRNRILASRTTLEKLRQLERASRRPLQFDELGHPLQVAVLQFYGSFLQARLAAKLRPLERPRKWSQQAVIDAIRRLHRQGVRITSRDLVRAGHQRVERAAACYAGGLRRARRLAGVPDPTRRRPESLQQWDEATVVSEIVACHRAGEPLARSKVSTALLVAGRRRFGSWQAAVEAAGIDYASVRLNKSWSDEDLLEEIRRLASRHPQRTFAEVAPAGLKSLVYARLGPIEVAAKQAGLPGWGRRLRAAHSRADTLRSLRARARAGESVQYAAVKDHDVHLWLSVRRHFATWAQALEAARVQDRSIRVWSRERVLEQLRARHKRGVSMDPRDVRRQDRRLLAAAARYFGSYVAAAARFGARPHRVQRWTRDALIAELRKLLQTRRPIARSLARACRQHFGSLEHALDSAGVARMSSNRC
jgi:hypothetical protein